MSSAVGGIEGQMSDALYRALAGRKISAEGRTVAVRVAEVIKAAGSQKAAAALMGIGPQTLRRWAKGTQTPSAAGLDKLKAAGRRVRLSAGRERNIREARRIPWKKSPYGAQLYSDNRMKITGEVRVSSDTRPRTIDVGKHIPLDVIGDIIDTWLTGDDRKAVDQLQRAIHEYYVSDLELLSISKIEFL